MDQSGHRRLEAKMLKNEFKRAAPRLERGIESPHAGWLA